jgi:hypothetical protein
MGRGERRRMLSARRGEESVTEMTKKIGITVDLASMEDTVIK